MVFKTQTKAFPFITQLNILLMLVFIIPCVAHAWTQKLDFEKGIKGTDGFGFIGTTVTQSNTISEKGKYSAKFHFPAGDTCWDKTLTCGAFAPIPNSKNTLGLNSELWTRAYYYFPVGWDWGDQDGAGSWRKILRYQIANRGRIEIGGVWPGGTATNAEIVGNTEAGNHYSYYDQFTHINFPIGRWFAIEQYVKFGMTDATTRHMIWLDGKLIFDSKNLSTDNPAFGSADDKCNAIMFFTYWNGKVRTTQDAYIDNIIITTDKPNGRDAQGNPMIGPDPVINKAFSIDSGINQAPFIKNIIIK